MPDQVGRCSHHEGKRLEAGYPQILSSSSALSDATSLLSDAMLSSADMQNVKFATKNHARQARNCGDLLLSSVKIDQMVMSI